MDGVVVLQVAVVKPEDLCPHHYSSLFRLHRYRAVVK